MGFLTRILESGFDVRPVDHNRRICKIRNYLAHVAVYQSSLFITMACIDRCAATCTNVKYRKFYESVVAYRVLPVSILFCFLILSHIPIWFETEYVLSEFNVKVMRCYARKGTYRLVFNTFFLIFYSIIPLTLMSVFGLITVRNIRHKLLCCQTQKSRYLRKKDHQLITMMLMQILLFIILTFPFAIEKFYSILTENNVKSSLTIAWDNFVKSVILLLLYTNYSDSFYLYTLSATVFRKEFLAIFQKKFKETTID
ncbi:unnamed protein product [Didymodactylos carnosus]|uniref:G-protein coupled receptors family 1 profile domain-containing protein n=1 Tax=Didymodactylos carnosus TaxID=1234261 RepID=A0A814V9G4_9BILA|nr:unnamed protein product [Didymodactylos carnosus]CAF1185179.1 unnamed protein product [Didymodactylos carnosus]CAF3949465.1 unnamed protein product [Didymodactylos carnosus]CAF3995155.1 unnamed protein product [Didymodactylos carnosus]